MMDFASLKMMDFAFKMMILALKLFKAVFPMHTDQKKLDDLLDFFGVEVHCYIRMMIFRLKMIILC